MIKKTLLYADFLKYCPTNPRTTAALILERRLESKVVVREWATRKAMLKYIEKHEKNRPKGEWSQFWMLFTNR